MLVDKPYYTFKQAAELLDISFDELTKLIWEIGILRPVILSVDHWSNKADHLKLRITDCNDMPCDFDYTVSYSCSDDTAYTGRFIYIDITSYDKHTHYCVNSKLKPFASSHFNVVPLAGEPYREKPFRFCDKQNNTIKIEVCFRYTDDEEVPSYWVTLNTISEQDTYFIASEDLEIYLTRYKSITVSVDDTFAENSVLLEQADTVGSDNFDINKQEFIDIITSNRGLPYRRAALLIKMVMLLKLDKSKLKGSRNNKKYMRDIIAGDAVSDAITSDIIKLVGEIFQTSKSKSKSTVEKAFKEALRTAWALANASDWDIIKLNNQKSR